MKKLKLLFSVAVILGLSACHNDWSSTSQERADEGEPATEQTNNHLNPATRANAHQEDKVADTTKMPNEHK